MRIGLVAISFLFAVRIFSQVTLVPAGEYAKIHPFLRPDSNVIIHPEALEQFFIKLACLEHDSLTRLRILHIGDSHIQADFFSGPVRKILQQQFGNAGRGLIFPYKIANTNGPSDIDVFSNTSWTPKRNVFPKIDMPVGISGISLKTGNPFAVMRVSLKAVDSVAQPYDQMTVYAHSSRRSFDLAVSLNANSGVLEKSAVYSENTYYTVKSGDNLGLIARKFGTTVSQLKAWNGLHSDFIRAGQKLIIKKERQAVQAMSLESFTMLDTLFFSDTLQGQRGRVIRFDQPEKTCYLHMVKTDSIQEEFVLQGILLENADQPGILYSMSGVNGAMYEHYNLSSDFLQQVRDYKPDLVILSLGTNETLGSYFDEEKTQIEMRRMIDSLRNLEPAPDILLTAPSDNMLRRRYPNKSVIRINELMAKEADSCHVALWNLFSVMGGHGSIDKWYKAGLARADRIHFTVAGYELQAALLMDALMEAYHKFKDNGLE